MSKNHKLLTGVIACIAFLSLLLVTTVRAQVTLKLLGRLDPFDGENRYGDVWGKGPIRISGFVQR